MGSIIDGRSWLRERIKHLEAALGEDGLEPEQRHAIEGELDRLRGEGQEATRRRRWWWMLGGPRT